MELIFRVTIGPNDRAERCQGKITETGYDTDEGREALFCLESDPTTNNVVNAELVSDEILGLFRVWWGADSLWTVTAVEQVDLP